MEKHYHRKISQKKSASFVRIIGGLWKGRKLIVHNVEGLRPTMDKVKETLFNWLAQEIPQAKCLDLFAGSGRLGFEAASRKAEIVVLIESDLIIYKQIQANILLFKASNVSVVHTDVLSYLKKRGSPYHVVFIDPPFHKNLAIEVAQLLERNGWLAENAAIYVETESGLVVEGLPSNWDLYRKKNTRGVSYYLFKRIAKLDGTG
ncbi:ribosomal RNA small subunit methyltransferase D [Candidatus Photodesmus blepharus]|uniref:Ribosomal RNA small subunit methyltransferase D n=1 Tax=Candidatus Photodesmus blepharonis TaxID=1179155 RepID=A0A084CNM6_9GAMM|nr:16S rRNA (guanine(966)-N(2))-methyltransferase RsmD [Candidatus Photodesmus blepharus]KEY91405.1 ribosomal RNA small subunit methyltransferase D [Candidatus Photodesmus blepharus]